MNDKQLNERIKRVSRGLTGKNVVAMLEEANKMIADIRTPLMPSIKPEIANEVRLGIIQVIEEFIISKIKVYSGDLEKIEGSDFE